MDASRPGGRLLVGGVRYRARDCKCFETKVQPGFDDLAAMPVRSEADGHDGGDASPATPLSQRHVTIYNRAKESASTKRTNRVSWSVWKLELTRRFDDSDAGSVVCERKLPMSKIQKPRKTRLKGTEAKKPCFDCGVTKDRFADFKPRWAGCVQHRTANGRRYNQTGCTDCAALIHGNIRQPRCIECDKLRPKKLKAAATQTPKPVKPKPVAVEPVMVEPKTESSPESVKLPEPVVVAKPRTAPVATSAADILALLDAGMEELEGE